ncbi:MAG TPA: transketolase C-terminal domain-containing protein, partial [Burkholderiaceae bacterium]|nr:transketolase C-terminal domain-containing protein [Burkholderiaceae bacterium]
RTKVPALSPEGIEFRPGHAVTLRAGKDVTLVAIGTMVSRALEAAQQLSEQGIDARVINAASVKPLDEATLLAAARETRGIVSIEEANVQGGLGSAIAELLVQQHPARMRILGIPGFAPTGSTAFLFEHFGLTSENIARQAIALLGTH